MSPSVWGKVAIRPKAGTWSFIGLSKFVEAQKVEDKFIKRPQVGH